MLIVIKTISKYLIGTFIVIQLIQVDIPVSKTDPEKEIKASKEMMTMFKTSCYDCHSNNVELPWYSKVAPFSWTISRHVDLGRKWLNFSIWETYTKEEKDKKLGKIYKSVYRVMPLDGYVKMHPEAALTKEQRQKIRDWTGKSPF